MTLRRDYYEEKHGLEIDGEVHAKVKHFSGKMEGGEGIGAVGIWRTRLIRKLKGSLT